MLDLENTLVVLLLLVGLLNARPQLPGILRWVIVGGVVLAFVTPSVPIRLPWELLKAVVVPLLMWQIAYRLVEVRWLANYRDAIISIFMLIGIAAVIYFMGGLAFPVALLFGLLVTSMVWQAAEGPDNTSLLGMLGPLTLAILLVETDPATAPTRYATLLLGGLALGAAIGYFGAQAAIRVRAGFPRHAIALGQVYLAYRAGLSLGVSSIAAAFFSVITFVAYGARLGLWSDGIIRPRLFSKPAVFIPAALALAFFGWQTHVPPQPALFIEIGLCLLVAAAGVGIGIALKTPTFSQPDFLRGIFLRLAVLLIPLVMLWQPGIALQPVALGIAMAAAGLTILGAPVALTPLLNFYRWLNEAGHVPGADSLVGDHMLVRDVMRREWLSVQPGTSVVEIARLFTESGIHCALVMDDENRLAGIVTEADLFVKTEQLPRTDRTYYALFQVPISTKNLAAIYPRLAEEQTANDIMSRDVIFVLEINSVNEAIRKMLAYGIKFLPVFESGAENDGRESLVGLINRTDLIHALARIRPEREPANED